MNWRRCSSALVALAVLLSVAAPAVAAPMVEGGSDVPEAAEVGSDVNGQRTVSFTVSDLYSDYDSWTLAGSTDLDDPTWTVTLRDNKGDKIGSKTVTDGTLSVDVEGEVTTVEVSLDGRVPNPDGYRYDPAQEFTLAEFVQRHGNSETTLETFAPRPYTAESQEARDAIDAAKRAVENANDAGADVSDARSDLDQAVSAFENANFENAISNAEDAESAAERARSSKEQNSMLLMVGGGVAAVVVVLGAGYWLLGRRQTHDRLG